MNTLTLRRNGPQGPEVTVVYTTRKTDHTAISQFILAALRSGPMTVGHLYQLALTADIHDKAFNRCLQQLIQDGTVMADQPNQTVALAA